MYPIKFERQRVSEILAAIGGGQPITPPLGGWSAHELMQLAGCCHFAAFSHGPPDRSSLTTIEGLPFERREAIQEDFYADLALAVEFYSVLASQVQDGNNQAGESLAGVVYRRDGEQRFQKYEG